jgi:hypothetical protein
MCCAARLVYLLVHLPEQELRFQHSCRATLLSVEASVACAVGLNHLLVCSDNLVETHQILDSCFHVQALLFTIVLQGYCLTMQLCRACLRVCASDH